MIKTFDINQKALLLITLISISYLYLTIPIILVFTFLFICFFLSKKFVLSISSLLPYFLSFNISLINMNRFPTHDLGTYIERYNYFGKLDLVNFLGYIQSDFIFYYTSNILYQLSDGSKEVFIFFWSFVIYLSISLSIKLLFKNRKIEKDTYIFVLIILFFSTTFISLSSHLIRQMVTGSIFIYYLTNLYFGNKKTYLLFIMIFIHFSSILLIMSLFFKNKKFFIFTSIITLFILVTRENIFELVFSHMPSFNNGYYNFIMHHINTAINKVKDDGDVSLITYATSIVLLIFLAFVIRYKDRKDLLIYFYPFLFSFLLFNIFTPIQLLWLRFSFYQYPFYFILFSFFFTYFQSRIKIFSIFYWLVSFLYFYIFYKYFEAIHWIDLHTKINIINFDLFKLMKLY